MQSATEQELQSVIGRNFNFLYDCGFTKPSIRITENDKVDIIQTISLHHVILRSKAELDQFAEGLQSCSVLDTVKKNPSLARSYFSIDGHGQMTAGLLEA